MEDIEPQLVENVWFPGQLPDLTSESLDRPCAHICPWWFLIAVAEKVLSSKPAFRVLDIFRNQCIPFFNCVTNTKFTQKTTALCYAELSRFVLPPLFSITSCGTYCRSCGTYHGSCGRLVF